MGGGFARRRGGTPPASPWLWNAGYIKGAYSTEQRTLVVADDTLDDGYFHVYELDLPDEFRRLKSKRWIRITLAYDPPVKGSRKEYFRRQLFFRLLRASSLSQIRDAASRGLDLKQVDISPGHDVVKGSTVQSSAFDGTRPSTFGESETGDSPLPWHVVVRSEPRLETDQLEPLRAKTPLVVSLEHTETAIRIYNKVQAASRSGKGFNGRNLWTHVT